MTTGLPNEDGSPVRVVLAEYAETGEWTLTYINRSDRPQTPIVHVEWPVAS